MAALLIALAAMAALFVSRRAGSGILSTPPAVPVGGTPLETDVRQRLGLLLATLMAAALALAAFVIGSYMVIRIGRTLISRDVGGAPTRYVDAWSNYRISDDEIHAATHEQDEGGEDTSSDKGESGPDEPDRDDRH
ncbi:MAG: hypothetical protein CHACPFDD_02748 [Phycisphaerae bacterium]|nr:hypothetical protein [Phycisphaerae bacterium]